MKIDHCKGNSNAVIYGNDLHHVTLIFDTLRKCKAQLDSSQGAFLVLQNKYWCFDLQVS